MSPRPAAPWCDDVHCTCESPREHYSKLNVQFDAWQLLLERLHRHDLEDLHSIISLCHEVTQETYHPDEMRTLALDKFRTLPPATLERYHQFVCRAVTILATTQGGAGLVASLLLTGVFL